MRPQTVSALTELNNASIYGICSFPLLPQRIAENMSGVETLERKKESAPSVCTRYKENHPQEQDMDTIKVEIGPDIVSCPLELLQRAKT